MDDQTFKSALSQWVAGVTIVTAKDGETVKGMTVSSFTSVSVNPYLILIAIDKKTGTHPIIEKSGAFAANIVHTGQIEWAMRFAGMMPEITDRFFDITYTQATTGSPILPDVIGWVDCKLHSAHEAGDHTIFVGEVVDAAGNSGNAPLLYHSRQWGAFNALPTQEE